ncbi:MAG: helix-turn-helix transcriptional regulator [Caloramator sp.]|jgi:CBS domain-containing protein/biotin operon repressor|uniref:CBS domain-containing protein n=1 Tax=Caloramator proteoclasticus DSM 10124 TaxID=1121262 RepID=A0A1M4WWD6_9CLOT|nr:helix-turn-helix transcriptional regulator [Caloramator sp.]SHE85554.1 CBS domain-containing protein [Caloramator proteoclasticus DSM 10124]
MYLCIINAERVITIKLTKRQEEIIELVKKNQPITSEKLAEMLNVTRAALRPDLAILTMTGILEARPKVGYLYSKRSNNSLIFEAIKDIKVSEIKSKPAIVTEDTTIYDAIVQLFLNDAGTIFIVNNGYLTGAVSRKDFLKIAMGNSDMHKVPVGIIMTRMPNIITVTDDDLAFDAAKKIIEHEVDSLPVVEKVIQEDGKELYKITGKVSKTNITKLFVRLGEGR